MYPGANDVTNGGDVPQVRNFWEVYVPGSWLNFLVQNDQQFTYFGRMSDAMAKHCGGTVCKSIAKTNMLSYETSFRPVQITLEKQH